jgi:hypothetical protein
VYVTRFHVGILVANGSRPTTVIDEEAKMNKALVVVGAAAALVCAGGCAQEPGASNVEFHRSAGQPMDPQGGADQRAEILLTCPIHSSIGEAARSKEATVLSGVVAEPMQRVPVRTGGSGAIESAWRLGVVSDQGRGGIVLVDVSPRQSCFQGDGVFLGWSQRRMAETYKTLTEPLSALGSDPVLPQLG